MEELTELRMRRNNRYEAIMTKIEDFKDVANYYNNKDSEQQIKKTIDRLKKKTKHNWCRTVESGWHFSWLDIDNKDKTRFIENIINELRKANECCLESQLRQREIDLTNDFLKNTISKIDESNRSKYYNAVKLLVRLDKIQKIDDLERDLFELKKDFIKCIDYNKKIERLEKDHAI